MSVVWLVNIFVRLRSVSFPQIHVQSLCHIQIHVLPKSCPLKSVSTDVTPRSMSFQKHISSDLCPPKYMFPQICVLWHKTQIKVICQKKYLHRSVSSTFWSERKNHLLQLTARFHIWDTNWYLVSITHLCSACFSFLQTLILLQYARFCTQDQEYTPGFISCWLH